MQTYFIDDLYSCGIQGVTQILIEFLILATSIDLVFPVLCKKTYFDTSR